MSQEKCNNARSNKGTRFPRCNNGNPCNACLSRYLTLHHGEPNEYYPGDPISDPPKGSGDLIAWADTVDAGFLDKNR